MLPARRLARTSIPRAQLETHNIFVLARFRAGSNGCATPRTILLWAWAKSRRGPLQRHLQTEVAAQQKGDRPRRWLGHSAPALASRGTPAQKNPSLEGSISGQNVERPPIGSGGACHRNSTEWRIRQTIMSGRGGDANPLRHRRLASSHVRGENL